MDVSQLLDAVLRRSISPNDFLAKLWRLSKGHRRTGRRYGPGTLTLYRTRVFSDTNWCRQVANLSYPPPEKCGLQRANAPGEQVFYASAGLPTTLAESRVRAGQY